MAKLYVFTLDFTLKRQKALHTLALLHQLSPPTTRSQMHSQEDSLGYLQYFKSDKPHVFSEPIEIHSFTRVFLHKTQVDLAAQYGCPDIKKFYSLISEIKLTEKIYIICRVIIHGSLRSDRGFQMEEDSQLDENQRAYIPPETVSKIIARSLPYEWKTIFTQSTPLNIQLVSCSAGGTKNYFHLESDSLAGCLMKSLWTQNIVATIQASTTTISYKADYWQFEMRKDPLVLHIKNIEIALDALFHESYYRRGFDNALHHINAHLANADDIKTIESLDAHLSNHCKRQIYVDTDRIIKTRKVGYKLLYSVTSDKKILVKDYSTGKVFIDDRDYLFEAHRDILLEYLWIEYLYNILALLNPIYSAHKVSASNNDLLFFIDKIECANNRLEFLHILTLCEQTLSKDLRHVHPQQSRIQKLLGYIFHRKIQMTHCKMQDINIAMWKRNFYEPTQQSETFFNCHVQ